MTTVSWKSGIDSDWSTGSDWSANAVPGIADDAIISVAGSYLVSITTLQLVHSLTLNAATATVSDTSSLNLGAKLTLTAGTFVLSNGGTINGGTVAANGGGLVFNGGVLSGVTYQGTLDMSQDNTVLEVANGIIFSGLNGSGAGTVKLTGNNAQLYIDGSTTLDNATIDIGNNLGTSLLFARDKGAGALLTLGSKLNLVHTGTTVHLFADSSPSDGYANQGAITAALAGGSFVIGGQTFSNTGTILASNGDSLVIQSATMTNTGTIAVSDGAGLTLSAVWSNAGKISETNAGLGLNGSFNTEALNSITRSGGGVSIGGAEDNTGATINVGTTAALGTLVLTGAGSITGGKVHDTGGGLVFNGGVLSGVTYQGTLDMSQDNTVLEVANGIIFSGLNGSGAGTVKLTGNNAQLYIDGSTTLDNATIDIGNNLGTSLLFARDKGAGALLTLGSKLNLVHTGTTVHLFADSSPSDGYANQGAITAALAGGSFVIGGQTFSNTGTILASNGDSLVIQSATMTNTGTIAVSDGAGLTLSAVWSNAGKISETNAGLGLNGSFNTEALNSITRSGGGVSIGGAEDNTGATINVGTTAALGTLVLTGAGSITGGKVHDTGGGLVFNGGVLSGVTYQGTLDMSQDNTVLEVANGIIFSGLNGSGAGTVKLTGNNAQLYIDGSTTLDNATIDIGNNLGTSLLFARDKGAGALLTLGSKLNLVHTGTTVHLFADSSPSDGYANQGTITAALAGGSFVIGGQTFSNTGTILASNGDSLVIQSATMTNTGTIAVSDGAGLTLSAVWSNAGKISETNAGLGLNGSFNTEALNSITRSGGGVSIGGAEDNTGATINVGTTAALGTLVLTGAGSITGGKVHDTGGGLVFNGGVLSGVTYQGTLDMSQDNTVLEVANGIIFSGLNGSGAGTVKLTGNNAQLYIDGSTTLDNATIDIGNNLGTSLLFARDKGAGALLTLGSKLNLVHTGTTVHLFADSSPSDGYANQGTITAALAGGSFVIGGQTFSNTGTILASNGDSLVIQSATMTNTGTIAVSDGAGLTLSAVWSNAGKISETNAGLGLNGSFNTEALNSITRSGGGVSIGGAEDNTGATINVGTTAALGTLVLTGAGSITGGKVHDTGGGLVFNGGVLSGVTYQGTLDMSQDNTVLEVANGIIFSGLNGSGAGTVKLTGNNAQLYIDGSTTLDNATIDIGNNLGTSLLFARDKGAGALLTLGSKLNLVHTGTTVHLFADSSPSDGYANQGTITAALAGGSFVIGGQTFSNTGTILASNGDSLVIQSATMTNTGTIAVSDGAGLTLSAVWSNAGKISETNAGLGLNGSFNTEALNSITRSGGGVSIGGAEDNTGATINVGTTAALGTLVLTGAGSITGGKVHDTGGGLVFNGGVLSGVTYQGTLDMSQDNTVLEVANGIIFSGLNGSGAGTVKLTGNNAQLYIDGSTTLDNATIDIGNNLGTSLLFARDKGAGALLTLGSKLNLVHTGTTVHLFADSSPSDGYANQGTITAALAGGSFVIGGQTFSNTGTILASNGDSLVIQSATLANLSGTTLTGGSFEVDAASTLELPDNANIVTDNANITLSGAGSVIQALNTSSNQQVAIDATLGTIGAAGALHLLNGRDFTTTADFQDQGLLDLHGATFSPHSLRLTSSASLQGSGKVVGSIIDNGAIKATGGTLTLANAISGTGSLAINAGAVLELGKNTASGQRITFNAAGATLKLDTPAGFLGTMDGFAPGDSLDLAGVLPANVIGAAINGNTLTVTRSNSSPLAYTLSNIPAAENLKVATDNGGGTLITAYGLAAATTHTPEPVAFGNHHVGDQVQATVSIGNAAPASVYYERLDATIGAATNGITASGSIAALAPQAMDATHLLVGIDTTASGTRSGTATITLSSDGSGIDGFGQTPLASQTVNLTGAVYALAAPKLSATTLNFGAMRLGGKASQSLTVSDGSASNAYQESLNYSLGTVAAGFKLTTAGAGTIASGANASIGLSLDTSTAGDFTGKTTKLALTSTGNGTSGLADTSLTAQSITLNGKVYAPAIAQPGTTDMAFGIVHVGDLASQSLTISNTTTGVLTDALAGGFGTVTAPFTGLGSLAGIAAGGSGTLTVGLNTASAGTFTGTAKLALSSHDADQPDVVATAGSITLSGTVNNFALPLFEELSGGGTFGHSGDSYTLNLGTIASSALPIALNLGVGNVATGPADALEGDFVLSGTGFVTSGFTAFSSLQAGQADSLPIVSLPAKAASGNYSETVTLHASGSNSSGYNGVLGDQTLTITATVVSAVQLTRTPTTIAGGAGSDLYIATDGVLYSGDSINGGGGVNTLQLQGAGTFDMRAPTKLANIQFVTAQEGQPAYALADGSVTPSQLQTLYLRDGLNLTVNIAADPTVVAANPLAPMMIIHGANNSDVINLASGNDIVFLGSTHETVRGGRGADMFHVTAATIGATIDGGSGGLSALFVDGGGTSAMGSNITNIAAVVLTNPVSGTQPDYVFTTNATKNLVITASAGNDTIGVRDPSQKVVTTGGNTHVKATSTNAGALVIGGSGETTLEITTGGSATLNAATTGVTVLLDAATTLTLSKMSFVSAVGSAGADTITALASGQTLTGGAGTDTLVGFNGFGDVFRDTAAQVNGDTIKLFGGSDVIDVSDLISGNANLGYVGTVSGGTLSVSDGTHATNITMVGNFSQALFHLADDLRGGTAITYG